MKRALSNGKVDEEVLGALGAAIRGLRKSQNISQEALADMAGIDRSHMGKIERGERNVTILNVRRVAAALGSSMAELFNEAGL